MPRPLSVLRRPVSKPQSVLFGQVYRWDDDQPGWITYRCGDLIVVNSRRAALAALRLPVDFLRARRGSPSSAETYLVVRRLHVKTAGRSTTALATMFRRLPGTIDRVTADSYSAWQQDAVDSLRADGLCAIPDVFTPSEVTELVEFARHGPASLLHSDGSRSNGTYHDRSADVVSVNLHQSFVLTRPAIQAMMARAMASSLAHLCNELRPTVHPPILYWSCRSESNLASSLEERLARRYHSDFDGLGGLRLHVYLTDVDDGAAPMDYVKTSHEPGAIPRSLRKDVTDDIAESAVRDLFPSECLHRFVGPAGTSFMSDSNGLHRGNTPTTSDRLFLVMPIQAGSFAGAFHRVRRVPVVDEEFGLALRAQRPDLRLFRPAETDSAKLAVIAD